MVLPGLESNCTSALVLHAIVRKPRKSGSAQIYGWSSANEGGDSAWGVKVLTKNERRAAEIGAKQDDPAITSIATNLGALIDSDRPVAASGARPRKRERWLTHCKFVLT